MADRKRSQKDTFSAREVGVLIEELRSEFRSVLEMVRQIKAEVDGLHRWRAVVDEKLVKLDFVLTELRLLRADLKAFDQRLKTLEAKVGV